LDGRQSTRSRLPASIEFSIKLVCVEDNRIEFIYDLSTETKVILLCPPDELWTELCDSLTAFYDNILRKSGAGGRPAAKNLSCKFVTQTTSVPNPPVVPCQYPLTTPRPTALSPCRRCSCRPCTAAGPCGGICRAPRKTGAADVPRQ
jgi:hypothetical protein